MIVIKLLLLGTIIMICSMMGNMKAKSFENRYLELKKFKNALGIFKSKLEFTYEPINEIFQDISKLVYEEKENAFQRFVESQNWDLAIEEEDEINR